ncbi:major facilitator superfamily domain-containing protein [Podospora australis]|uniref:Major facilitator superfamily domain-containing protein n=1 Tax=Podospora australis TaxID=1536484 RepID=A0AAN7AMW4_9PEZI|nr:major facilitator superfamily domain-containing protein [Podospora australis]
MVDQQPSSSSTLEDEKEKGTTTIINTASNTSRSTNSSQETLSTVHQHDVLPPTFTSTEDAVTIVSFEPDDPANPYNWTMKTKALIILAATLTGVNSTMGSIIASANLFYDSPNLLQATFNVPTGPQSVLPASLYLVGFVFGPLIFAPLSESPSFGRKPILVTGFVLFVISTLGASFANSWALFLVMRFLSGTFGSPPLSVFGGCIADVFSDKIRRGRMLMVWSAATFVGPLGAPILGGFLGGRIGWRWVFWITLIVAGVTFVSVLLIPETLAARILRQKARRLNKLHQGTGKRFVAPADLEKRSVLAALKTTLSRPLKMLSGELVVIFTSLYIAFIYAVFYMMVQVYPAIFKGVYGFNAGITGIMFSIIGVGTIIGCCICWWSDNITLRLSMRHPTRRAEYLRLPLACVFGPVFVISILWIGLTGREEVHWAVPMIGTIPYGIAYNCIWISLINYVADAYGIYSASALAALGTTRSIAGALIPLAVEDMLKALGIARSCAILAGISAALALVPFGFIAYGDRIRAGSKFSASLNKETTTSGEGEAPLERVVTSLSAV